MNEQILEYAEQARLYAKSVFPHSIDDPIGWNYEYHKKFAELIVRECMLCCERVISDPVPKSADTWLNGGSQCIDEIKQHFGVEE